MNNVLELYYFKDLLRMRKKGLHSFYLINDKFTLYVLNGEVYFGVPTGYLTVKYKYVENEIIENLI